MNSTKQTVSEAQLLKIVQLSASQLAAAVRDAAIPKPRNKQHEVVPTLIGLIKWLDSQLQKDKNIRLTISRASEELNLSRETVRRSLKAANIAESPDGKLSIKEFISAIYSDSRDARSRLVAAKAQREEFDLQVAKKEFMSTEDTRKFIIANFSPLRDFIVSQPSRLAALVNPDDPAHARSHLERDRDEFLKYEPKLP